MKKCSYCPSEKNLSVDGMLTISKSETRYICEECINKLEESLMSYKKLGLTREDWTKEVVGTALEREISRLKQKKKTEYTKNLALLNEPFKKSEIISLDIENKINEFNCSHKCKKCNTVGILESNGGIMIPINEKVTDVVDLEPCDENSNIRASYSTWDFTLCKRCLNTIQGKRIKKLKK